MQEKLARLHFSLDSHVEELSEDQKKCASDHNLEHLLCNVSMNHSRCGLGTGMHISFFFFFFKAATCKTREESNLYILVSVGQSLIYLAKIIRIIDFKVTF